MKTTPAMKTTTATVTVIGRKTHAATLAQYASWAQRDNLVLVIDEAMPVDDGRAATVKRIVDRIRTNLFGAVFVAAPSAALLRQIRSFDYAERARTMPTASVFAPADGGVGCAGFIF